MSNLVYNTDATLPSYELSTAQDGSVIGVKVRRLTRTVYYHRTGRGPNEMIDAADGELNPLFRNTQSFSRFSENRIVLDLGCGDGKLVSAMARLGTPILGLDLHLSAQQHKEDYFIQGDAFRMTFNSNTVDCVISTLSVFHYEPLHQIGQLFRESFRVLREGGMLVIPSLNHLERVREIRINCDRLKADFEILKSSNLVICTKR